MQSFFTTCNQLCEKRKYRFISIGLIALGGLIILTGLILNYFYGVTGTFYLLQGTPSSLNSSEAYKEIPQKPFIRLELPPYRFLFESFLPSNENKKGNYIAEFILYDADNYADDYKIKLNGEFKYQNYDFTLEQYGYAPTIVVYDSKTGVRKVISTRPFKSSGLRHSGILRLPDGKVLNLVLFPNKPLFEARMGNDKWFLKMDKKHRIGKWLVRPIDLNHWAKIGVKKDIGKPFLYIGLPMLMLGLACQLLLKRFHCKNTACV